MQDYKIDVPVLIMFFIRDEVLAQTFASVREARPSVLLLWQDGPRANRKDDIDGINKCRKIVENIDWDCTVYRNYHDENMGCDPSTFRAQKWAFSIVDKCIVLEDDMVPSQSFYPFCKELLDKYEFDNRINHICGVNYIKDMSFCPNDYLFSYYGTGAWASWRRVAREWDENYSFLDKKYYMDNLSREMPKLFHVVHRVAVQRRQTGYEWWETIIGFNCFLNHRLVIIPRQNLVCNVGVTPEATHGSSLRLMSSKVRSIFFMQALDIKFPLKHPEYIVPDYKFMDEMSEFNCIGRPWLARLRWLEYAIKYVLYGELFKKIRKKIQNE